MSNNDQKKLKIIKSLIIPQLPSDFHQSLFFSEIEYKKNPSKQLRKQLINLYMQGIDYYNTKNKKDLSLYFQTKLLNIMKGVDYFEKILEKKTEENEDEIDKFIETKKFKCLQQEKNIENNLNKNITEQLKGQEDQFLHNLSIKKKLIRYKRINSVSGIFRRNTTHNNLGINNKKLISSQLNKKVSVDFSSAFISKEIDKNKNSNSNSIFSKIENSLNGLDRINTLLILEYVKKLKQYMKNEIQNINEITNKYKNYIKIRNELNLIYKEFDDKNDEGAKCIKEQMDLNEKEWENSYKNKDINEIDKYSDIVQFDEKNLDNFVNNIFKKIEEFNINNK